MKRVSNFPIPLNHGILTHLICALLSLPNSGRERSDDERQVFVNFSTSSVTKSRIVVSGGGGTVRRRVGFIFC